MLADRPTFPRNLHPLNRKKHLLQQHEGHSELCEQKLSDRNGHFLHLIIGYRKHYIFEILRYIIGRKPWMTSYICERDEIL